LKAYTWTTNKVPIANLYILIRVSKKIVSLSKIVLKGYNTEKTLLSNLQDLVIILFLYALFRWRLGLMIFV